MKKTQTSELEDLPSADSPNSLIETVRAKLATANRDFDTMPVEIAKRMMFGTRCWGLTRTGYSILSSHFRSYCSKNPKNGVLTGKILLNMDACCNGPWYIQSESVYVFDSVLHFEMEMVSGNLNDFIDFKKPQKN